MGHKVNPVGIRLGIAKAELAAQREKARIGMANGDERYLPVRDKGQTLGELADAAVVVEVLGSALVPTPLLGTTLAELALLAAPDSASPAPCSALPAARRPGRVSRPMTSPAATARREPSPLKHSASEKHVFRSRMLKTDDYSSSPPASASAAPTTSVWKPVGTPAARAPPPPTDPRAEPSGC